MMNRRRALLAAGYPSQAEVNKMTFNITVLKGDGIGPEVVNEAIKVLSKVAKKYSHHFNFTEALIGGIAYDSTGTPLPQETIDACKMSDAVLLGAVGGPKWDALPGPMRPESGLLGIRKALNLYANIRPAVLFEALKSACPLRESIAAGGIDITVVRELTGGIYFGEKARMTDETGVWAYDINKYSEGEIIRIAHVAFRMARQRKKSVISIDKANVLETSKLWRETVIKVAKEHSDVTLSHMLVDNAAMQLVKNPAQFDVVLADNIFGDILSDETAMITGSIGILPSASMGDTKFGLFEPIHGSAPDIAGQNKANPIATILSAAMMLRYSLQLEKEADTIEKAISDTLNAGLRTADLRSTDFISCCEMGNEICKRI